MKNIAARPEGGSASCSNWCCGTGSFVHRLMRLILIFLILGLIFFLGAGTGVKAMLNRLGLSPQGARVTQWDDVRMMGDRDGRGMMFGRGLAPATPAMIVPREEGIDMMNASGTVKLFGSITKISDNKITIMDNGAKSQIVLSQADTMISASTGELSLSSLKVGQNVSIIAKTEADGTMTAKVIRVM